MAYYDITSYKLYCSINYLKPIYLFNEKFIKTNIHYVKKLSLCLIVDE